jgi:hypothetical protein
LNRRAGIDVKDAGYLNGASGVLLYITQSETTHTIIKITESISTTATDSINAFIRLDEREVCCNME